MPPSTSSCGRPSYFFASMTQMPVRVTARWSMFARDPGMRRSCRTRRTSPASSVSRRHPRAGPGAHRRERFYRRAAHAQAGSVRPTRRSVRPALRGEPARGTRHVGLRARRTPTVGCGQEQVMLASPIGRHLCRLTRGSRRHYLRIRGLICQAGPGPSRPPLMRVPTLKP
jgi:hypothetical protein